MKSLLLDGDAWDLVLDANGNIAVASEPYAISQDVACACRLFKGELYYNVSKGIPYFDDVLGHWPPLSIIKEYLKKASLTVPLVNSAKPIIYGVTDRRLTGEIQFIDITGAASGVTF